MRVLCVNPNREQMPWPVVPVGLSLVATALEAAGHDVAFLDLTFEGNPTRAVERAVRRHAPEWVALSVRNLDNCNFDKPVFFLPEIRDQVVAALRAHAPAARLVVGGAAVNVCPTEILEYLGADYAIVGEGEERAQLEPLAQELGLREKLHFAGFVNDVQAALNACDVVVIPSLREGFGLILAEAMAAGRPIVATRVGGMLEMAQHEQQVLFVPPANSSALAQAALRLLQDQNLATRLAEAARTHSENFSIEKNVAALEALYLRLDKKPLSRQIDHAKIATLAA
ncbi:glycosyltransferase [candidate division KSB1 bacterium]|nr:glycosyltransferase [candidate division KSB1 bacterium]